MKINKSELDVDFIGGQGPLTIDEEKAISEFLKNRKSQQRKGTKPNLLKAEKKHSIAKIKTA